MRKRLLTAIAVAGTLVSFLYVHPAQADVTERTVVTMTFDDGRANSLAAVQLLNNHGMDGTFYINSALTGTTGYMTLAELQSMAAAGHEIGGHTVSHQSLLAISPTEANRQVCNDRNTLLGWGFDVTSFAYPYADFNSAAETIVENCGYNSARIVGDIYTPATCTDCDLAETMPPVDPFAIRTPDEITSAWTLAELQDVVIHAESTGGWVVFNYHNVCDACGPDSVSPAIFDDFLAWLETRAALGTVVKPVNAVVAGAVKPAVPAIPPPDPGGPEVNMVQNPSLEMPSPAQDVPTCWTQAGYGTNTATFDRVTDAHTGTYGGQINITAYTSGDAKALPPFDLGSCSLPVAQGHVYSASAWYKSDAPVFFTYYKRNAVGQWSYWGQSPRFAPSDDWTEARWLTPTVSGDLVAASFGLTLDSAGTLTTDDYGFADWPGAEAAPPGVNALSNPSLETVGGDGFPFCWTGAGYGANNVVWTRSEDASAGTYAQKLEITSLTDGDAKLVPTFDSENCAPIVNVGAPYAFGADYKSTAPVFYTLYRQDTAGNWSYWTQSPTFPASETYTRATWTSPEVPAGTRAVTFGLTLDSVGTLTTDNYTMVDTTGS